MKQYFKVVDEQTLYFYNNCVHDNGKTYPLVINGYQVFNPSEETLFADGWQEYTPTPPQPYVPTTKELIQQEIREKYEPSDEWMLNRQMNNALNPNSSMSDDERANAINAFNEYNAYVEEILEKYKN